MNEAETEECLAESPNRQTGKISAESFLENPLIPISKMVNVQEWVRAARPPSPLPKGAIDVWLLNLDTADPSLADLLDDEERARISRFVFERDARRSAAARGYLRSLLANYLAIPANTVRFSYGEWGKASIAGECESRHAFNVAHSGSFALIAIGAVSALGVDIEQMRTVDDWRDIVEGSFTDAERSELLALPVELQQDAFFAWWTRKEALLKLWGTGLSTDLASFTVSVDPRAPAGKNSVSRPEMKPAHANLLAFRPRTGYWAALAAPMGEYPSMRFFQLVP